MDGRRFVFDLESGNIIDKNTYTRQLRETRKVITKRKRKENYEKWKEIKHFLKQVSDLPTAKPRKLPTAQRVSKEKIGGDMEHTLSVEGFTIVLRTINLLNGQGGASRSIAQAEKTWKEVSINTKFNCLYTAVCLGKNKHMYKELMEKPNLLTHQADMLKCRLKDKFDKNPKRTFSNDVEIQMCSDYLKTPITLYNNLFMKIREFLPENTIKDKRTKPREVIEIRIANGHYTTLLRMKDLSPEDLEVSMTPAKPDIKEIETTLERNGDVFYEVDEFGNQIGDEIIKKKNFEEMMKRKENAKRKKDKDTKEQPDDDEDRPDTLYGAYDIECSPDPNNNNYHKAYACGFAYHENRRIWDKQHEQYINIVNNHNIQFWGLDCQTQFVKYLQDNMEKLHKYTIYAHNGGRYDFQNLFREALCQYQGDIYIKNPIELNGRIISFQITDGHHHINFRDSVCIFAGQSLDNMTKELDVEHKKLKELVNHKQITLENYMTHKKEIEKYLTNDCLGLLECILEVSKEVYKSTSINLSQVFTGATLSKKFFYKKYYDPFKTPIYYLTRKKDEFIRKTYFGGRNEVFKLGAVNDRAYYYDFTSLYPAMAQKYLPYGEPMWVQMSAKVFNDNFFGFCDVWVKTKDFTKKPLHAHLTKMGQSNKLVFPHFQEWTKLRLFSAEIRMGIKHNLYKYKFDDTCVGIQFNAKPFMYGYFQSCFENKAKAKAEGNDALAQVFKIIANSGYGFWGLRWADRESVIFGRKDDINVYEYLTKGKLINECTFNNSQYCSIVVQKDPEMRDFNVSIASAITSYARQRLWELINTIEGKGCEVFYCDTDSVITNCDITKHPDIMKEFCWDGTGDALGSLKNELLDKIVKHNKKNKDKAIDINKQKELDGGDLYFDECFICGCKFYAVAKTLYNGEKIFMTKLKGFKDYEDSKLEYAWFSKLVNGEISQIEQVQEQWNMPKSSMADENRVMGLKIVPVHKKFKINYTKGILDDETGKITPFVL